ncbi:hypothetical protein V6N13_051587 [Hibiscus sabdariffa]|uniref:Protein kinase domain-containing protein n=1 Tax=Hibiscus sabdariffa TaxID=183260 RepID=A0ABR2T3V0_9ROSI
MSAALLSSLVLILLPTLCFSQSDADSLLKFKKSLKNGDSKLKNWIPNSSPCRKNWVGVVCEGQTITGLRLSNLGLTGSIDVGALTKLRDLRTISLVKNSFTGPIPEFNKLGALNEIYLSNNQFSGEIPNTYFASMGSLKKLWLNDNNFTGHIPFSLMILSHLTELHLEGNQFSGKIPELKYPTVLKSLDLSGNKLEGNIPECYSKFNTSVFQGNAGLCGKQLTKQCVHHPPLDKPGSRSSTAAMIVTLATLVVVFFFVIVGIASTMHNKDDDLRNLSSSKETLRSVYPLPSSTRQRSSGKSRSSLKIKLRSQKVNNKNGMNDIVMVNEEKGVFGMNDLMNAEAEVLGNGQLGSAYKAVLGIGLAVVVKRMKEMNKLGKDGFGVEMKRIGNLKHPNVMTPLAFYFRKEEKLIVSEYMPHGSLLHALHDNQEPFHAKLTWENRLKIIKGIAEGLGYIHTQLATNVVPHGNLKTSNVLLTETYDPLLTNYGFHPFINSDRVSQRLFAYKSPECLQNQQHVSPKSDVYCLGIVILETMTGKYPSQYMDDSDGGIDVVQWAQSLISANHVEKLIDHEILASCPASVDQMVTIIRIGLACTKNNLDRRLSLNEAISKIQEVN